eukprot:scaffold11602_cov54-Cyclotella_meneghiniana.AAC.1
MLIRNPALAVRKASKTRLPRHASGSSPARPTRLVAKNASPFNPTMTVYFERESSMRRRQTRLEKEA